MQAMSPVRTAIIGLGYFGPNLLRNFAAQSDCEMAYLCDAKEANVDKARKLYPAIQGVNDAQKIMEDGSVDLVIIATPTTTHFPLAKQALEAGKHVFIEKPMTATLQEAEELVKLAESKGKMIFVDHTFCFAPAVRHIADMAKSGALGDLLYFDSVRINLGLIQKDANVLQDLAIHDLSILAQMINLGDVSTVCSHGSSHFGEQKEDAHIHLTTKQGFTAHIHVSWLSPVKVRRTTLAGTKSMVIYDDTEPSEKIRVYDRGVERDETKPDPFFPKYRSGDIVIPALPAQEPLAVEAAHVLKCIQGKEKAIVSGKDALALMRLLGLCQESLKQRSAILSAQ